MKKRESEAAEASITLADKIILSVGQESIAHDRNTVGVSGGHESVARQKNSLPAKTKIPVQDLRRSERN